MCLFFHESIEKFKPYNAKSISQAWRKFFFHNFDQSICNLNKMFVIFNKMFVILNKMFVVLNKLFVILNKLFVILNKLFVILKCLVLQFLLTVLMGRGGEGINPDLTEYCWSLVSKYPMVNGRYRWVNLPHLAVYRRLVYTRRSSITWSGGGDNKWETSKAFPPWHKPLSKKPPLQLPFTLLNLLLGCAVEIHVLLF